MLFYIQIALAIFWMIVLPAYMGVVILRKERTYTLLDSIVGGYLIMLSVGEVVTLPLIYLNASLDILTIVMVSIFLLFSIIGILLLIFGKRKLTFIPEKGSMNIYFLLGIVIIIVQIVMVILLANTDADDSFYVATATTGVYTNTIFSVNPYTGIEYTKLPLRYVLSQFPTFLSVISRLCLNLHPAILAHTVFAPIFICFSYMVQMLLARKWFPERMIARGMYILFVSFLLFCCGYSLYNSGIFEMTRIWQGKGFLAAAFLPLLLYLNLDFYDKETHRYHWYWLFLADLSCCYLSSMGIILAIAVSGILAIVYIIRDHKIANAGIVILCMLPSFILGVIYVTMHMENL